MKNPLVVHTPLTRYAIGNTEIWVKREDLCCPAPGPSFSKMRGVVAHLKTRPERVIGVLDTYHSKAGWAVAYAGQALHKQVVVFWPRYVADGDIPLPRDPQKQAARLQAHMIDLPAGRSSILYHAAQKILARYPDSYMMPNALKLPESVVENAAEVGYTAATMPKEGVLVISISSGTVAAGVVRGLAQAGILGDYRIFFHMGYSRSKWNAQRYIQQQAGVEFFAGQVEFIDERYDYKKQAKGIEAPFPCNPYYDLKAWKWLTKNIATIALFGKPIVFWNIGD